MQVTGGEAGVTVTTLVQWEEWEDLATVAWEGA